MPRKVNYGVDFDQEDYSVYEDYDDDFYDDYDQDSDVEGYEETSKVAEASKIDQATTKPGLWRCPMCTFDNAESLSACDICGVFRVPLVNNNGNKETVYDVSKGPGASLLAKSLFAPQPRRTLEKAVLFQQKKDDLASKETYNFHRIGNIQAPFKFDSVPPGDLASSGSHSTKKAFKANIVGPAPSTTSSSTVGKKEKANKLPSIDTVERSSNLVRNVGHSTSDASSSSSVNSLTKSFDKVNFDADPGVSQNGINTKKPTLRTQYKPEKWMLPDQEGKLTQLNLAIVGHVDSGKSTLSGRLLSLLGRISAKEMHKYQKESKLQGKGSFAYAWALDESTEERERGITMTVGVAYFQSKKYHVVLLDSPGHRDFVPNMISGATQADAAILVIDASIGSFEAGIDANGGQTREHAQLIRSFGVDQVIVAINKMDAVDYSMERFDSIKLQLGIFLCSCGFKDSFLSWIPLSAIENQNLVGAASDARLSSWYQGSNLLDAVDSLEPPIREISKPLRIPICDAIKSHSLGSVAASGKLEAGAIRCGLKVLVLPSGDLATVRYIERDSNACTIARAGDNVAVSLQGIDGNRVMTGGMLCHPDYPVAVATHLELKVLILDIVMPILIGSQLEFHVHHAKEAARVTKIVSLFDQKTGKVSKRAPRCLTAKQSASIEVILDGAVCVEEFSDCRALGRVFLRASGRTVAVGIITRIIQ